VKLATIAVLAAGCAPAVADVSVSVARSTPVHDGGSAGSADSAGSAPKPPAALPSCATAVVPPLDEPRFAPTLGGELTLVRADGDARLSAEAGILAVWSRDAAFVTFADSGAVTTWRSRDGKLVDLVRCAPGDMGANQIVVSTDGRWVVVSGELRDPVDTPATCIVDRSTGRARVIGGATVGLAFDEDGRTVRGDGRAIDLETGAVRPAGPSPAPLSGSGREGGVTVSHDGRYLGHWTGCGPAEPIHFREIAPGISPSPNEPILEVSERGTNRVLWRVPSNCTSWRFSPGDRFLEKDGPRWEHRIFRALTGETIDLPGAVLEIAPDDARVIVVGWKGPELFSLDPVASIVGGARHRTVAARSPDGAVTVAIDADRSTMGAPPAPRTPPAPPPSPRSTTGALPAPRTPPAPPPSPRLVLERGDRCIPLDRTLPFGDWSRDVLRFTPDGSLLYAGLYHDGRSELRVWGTDTGAVERTLVPTPLAAVYPMPAAGRVGFGVNGGVRVYDALRGTPLAVARAPLTRYTRPNARGTSWPVRDLDGDRPDRLERFVAATADGRHLVGVTSLGTPAVTIWDLASPRQVLDLPLDDFIEIATLSPDERFLAACGRHGGCGLWTREGRSIPLVARHAARPAALAFSPDGTRLAAAFADGLIDVIDTMNGRTAGTVALASQHATALWWSPDGKRLVIDSTRHLQFEVSRP
jgi:hypothetical protein